MDGYGKGWRWQSLPPSHPWYNRVFEIEIDGVVFARIVEVEVGRRYVKLATTPPIVPDVELKFCHTALASLDWLMASKKNVRHIPHWMDKIITGR